MSYTFLHGMNQNPHSFTKLKSYLEGEHNTVDLYKGLNSNEFKYENIYNNFVKEADVLTKDTKLNLCGVSLGAIISLNYCLEYPNKVSSIVLISPQYKIKKLGSIFKLFLLKNMPESAFEDFSISKENIITLTDSMIGIDFSNDLKNINCNSIVIYGENDRNLYKKASRHISSKIKNCTVKEVKNAGHEVNIDNPEDLANILT